MLTIVGVVIGEVALYAYMKARERPKIVIDVARKEEKLGFKVSVKRRMIKDARIRCNNISYPWEENNTNIGRKDLYVGDEPSLFFPFQAKVEYVDDVSNFERVVAEGSEESGKGILITVRDIATQKIIYRYLISIPTHTVTMQLYARYADKPRFSASIRIIGEGIEEEHDYALFVGLNNISIPVIKEGKPLMDYISYSFELKKRGLFR